MITMKGKFKVLTTGRLVVEYETPTGIKRQIVITSLSGDLLEDADQGQDVVVEVGS